MWSTGMVKEALDLAGVQVHGQHAVGSRQLEHVGDQAGRDGLARLRLAILPRVGEERHHRGDALRRGELRGLDHEEQLHQVLVDRPAAGLHEEDVCAADRLVVTAVRLAVREGLELDPAQLDAQVLGDLARKLRVRPA